MELLYIYIDKFKGLDDLDINFGGEYRFKFKIEESNLEVEKNELYLSDFYNIQSNGAKVVNVSSIIGENGTGKSSILQFIKDNFSSGRNLEYSTIIVLKHLGKIKILSTFEGVNVKGADFPIELIDNPTKDEVFNFGYSFRGFESTDIIYFSNIFDGTPCGSMSGLYDISTNGLIYEDYKSNREQKINIAEKDNVAVLLAEDIDRQIRLVTSDTPRELFPFRLPKTLEINIYDVLNSFGKDSNEYSEFEKLRRAIKGHYIADFFKIDDVSVVEDTANLHVHYLIAAVLESLIRELLEVQARSENLGFSFKFSSNFILKDDRLVQFINYKERIDYFFKLVYDEINNNSVSIKSLKILTSNCERFVGYILGNKEKFYNSNVDHRNPTLYLDLYIDGISNENFLTEFENLYRFTYSINRYLKFSWRNLSTGENALLNIYSRFYSLCDKVRIGGQLQKHLIILIDEGDTYLHPSWQKKLLFNLLEFLPVIFSNGTDQRTIQIILTTNSPIPASDFLNHNTIFFQKVGSRDTGYKTIVKDSLNEQKTTFAANIHTLLSDSFFINDGLRGEFANYKINAVIDLLTNISNPNIAKSEILTFINQIGEPLIKNSLREMFFQRFPKEISNEIDRLKELQKRYDFN